MTIREAIRAEQKSMKNRSFQEKLQYFFEYHALKLGAILLAIVVVICFVVNFVTQKDTGYNAVFFGGWAQPSVDAFMEGFSRHIDLDMENYEVTIQDLPAVRLDNGGEGAAYPTLQSFATLAAAGMVDNMAADVDLFLYYGYMGHLVDLRTVLTPQQLQALSPHLYYIDQQLLEQQAESYDGLVFEFGKCPDPKAPEAMEDPIPVGLDISAATEEFQNCYQFVGTPVMGISISSQRPETAQEFLKYCFGLSAAS